MHWIHDIITENHRDRLGLSKWGFTIQHWEENPDGDGYNFFYQELFLGFKDFVNFAKSNKIETTGKKCQERWTEIMVTALSHYGTSSDAQGVVPDLFTICDCGIEFPA